MCKGIPEEGDNTPNDLALFMKNAAEFYSKVADGINNTERFREEDRTVTES